MLEQAMVLIALLFSGMIVILGLWGFVFPGSIAAFVRSWSSIGGMWLAVAMRLAFAVVLWFSAPLSRTELVLQGLAVVVAISGAVLPLFGYTRFKAFIDWFANHTTIAMRLWCLVAIGVGGFVFWSVVRPITIPVPEQLIEYVHAPYSAPTSGACRSLSRKYPHIPSYG